MDSSEIDSKAVTTDTGFHFGEPDAPVKVIEFINLRCPFCKMWWQKADDVLKAYEKNGQIERIVKHFDKEKPGLDKGNVLHSYLDYRDMEKTRQDIDYYVDHLDEWGSLPKDDIAVYAGNKRNAKKQDNSEESKKITLETKEVNITMVPTVIIGEHIFDENISAEELKIIIESEWTKSS